MQKQILRIIYALLVLTVLAMLAQTLLGVNVHEGFLFSNPESCGEVCSRAGDQARQYCDSPYLKDGPAALCNCSWSGGTCHGSKAMDSKCAL